MSLPYASHRRVIEDACPQSIPIQGKGGDLVRLCPEKFLTGKILPQSLKLMGKILLPSALHLEERLTVNQSVP